MIPILKLSFLLVVKVRKTLWDREAHGREHSQKENPLVKPVLDGLKPQLVSGGVRRDECNYNMKFDDPIGDPISITVLLVLNILQLGFDLEAILRGRVNWLHEFVESTKNSWSPSLPACSRRDEPKY
jgi:hypothetical protein